MLVFYLHMLTRVCTGLQEIDPRIFLINFFVFVFKNVKHVSAMNVCHVFVFFLKSYYL